MKKMATSLSSYWVKFFTGAGFPIDVATKHAVVFSNNRIKPDMLPDLDKPSLKEMGITLMGDMIAILRYAKKISEEMTCERFLVDNIDNNTNTNSTITTKSQSNTKTKINQTTKLPVKKIVPKTIVPTKSISNTMRGTLQSSTKLSNTSQSIQRQKKIIDNGNNNVRNVDRMTKLISTQHEPQLRKRKIITQTEIIDSSDSDNEEWTNKIQKRLKTTNTNDNDKLNETNNYKILISRQKPQQQKLNQNIRSLSSTSQILNKKVLEQKRTVFDRLGDSSVTSTTNLIEPSTTFNITGLGSDILKRNSSVFNRLGERDVKNDIHSHTQSLNSSKNGNNNSNNNNGQQPHGILKSKMSNIGSTTVKLMSKNNIGKISTGTMHADHERIKKNMISSSVKQLVRTTKGMKLNSNNHSVAIGKNTQKVPSLKLASERISVLPAKARLGLAGVQKQVTFNKIATVKHIKKPGVFSRLGV